MGFMDRIKEEASSAMSASFDTSNRQPQEVQMNTSYEVQKQRAEAYRQQVQQQQQQQHFQRAPHYVVLQVTLKEKFIGTGSGNLSELENVINAQAAQGYRLHTISTASGGSAGIVGGDRIQATMVFERL